MGAPIGPTVPKDSIRQEILLEKAPAAKLISYFEHRFQNVKFSPHPTMNGFYATGSKRDILSIKTQISSLDGTPESTWPRREAIRVHYSDLNEISEQMRAIFPTVELVVDEEKGCLNVYGPPDDIERIKKTLAEIDLPP